jgi:hypothetical protein
MLSLSSSWAPIECWSDPAEKALRLFREPSELEPSLRPASSLLVSWTGPGFSALRFPWSPGVEEPSLPLPEPSLVGRWLPERLPGFGAPEAETWLKVGGCHRIARRHQTHCAYRLDNSVWVVDSLPAAF